jgi:hypothetical protein
MQSRATEGTLIANALAAGYAEEDIEEKEVTAEEWAAILAAETAPTYADLRRAAYPPVADFLDARVKQHSLDSTIRAAGAVQEEAYLTACLEVKERFPKPQA